jgi:hypothetical protein
MTAEKGKSMKKSTAVVAGAIMALGMATPAVADAGAQGAAVQSPGVGSGNVVQAPVHVPFIVCGDSVTVIGFLNPTVANPCVNE